MPRQAITLTCEARRPAAALTSDAGFWRGRGGATALIAGPAEIAAGLLTGRA